MHWPKLSSMYSKRTLSIVLLLILTSLIACKKEETGPLPYYGQTALEGTDTVYHQIIPFSLLDQDSTVVTNASLQGQIYVADFFFTSCPTICPVVKQNMIKIAEAISDNRLAFMAHSIDHRRDSIPRLLSYKQKLELDDRWHLLEVPEDELEELSASYLTAAYEDASAPGGFDHQGNLMLIDWDGHIRSYADGTDREQVDDFIKKIKRLLHEMDHRNE